ncbi:unnamed protein product [Auanema sp. JU1783]|nr:unnamed protein product [Auanema sp. JU1783]
MDALSDDDHDFDDDVLPGPSREYPEEEMTVDDAICTLLASLHLDQNRNIIPSDQDDDNLRIVHERIQNVIHRELDDSRRRRLRKALQPSNCIREQVYYLRRIIPTSNPSQSYFRRLSAALSLIVSESFDEEYRKVAILLGLVDALAETLVLEVFVFGTNPRLPEHRSIRKLVANALTNLTFGHVTSKRRLCTYPDFLNTVIRLINEARNLAQVYAGLIRNLSWLADSEMSAALSPCVKALVRAAVYGCQHKDEGCVRATLSALWNLASHSMENKRAICDEPGCLHMLASLLTPNTNQTVIVESASGILKYASVYLSTTSSHLEERTLLVNGLIQLLVSASFTISCNALGALSNLIAKDPHLQGFIRSNGSAMHQLNSLRDSARDDIRAAVKSVLNHLNQPAGYIRSNEMSTSMGVGYDVFRDSGRLLPLRSMRASPGANNLSSFTSPRSMEQRSSSLPRHFVRGGSVAVHGSTHASPSHYLSNVINQTCEEHDRIMMQQVNDDEIRHNNILNDDDVEDNEFPDEFERDTMSATCNRSNASRQSLETEHTNQSGWASMLDTANNSARLSPVSPSDLPDSPTHYTLIRQQNLMNAGKGLDNDSSAPLRINVMSSDAGGKSNFSSSDAATAVVDDQPTPTFANCRISQIAPVKTKETLKNSGFFESFEGENESDYAVLEGNSELLDRSIEAAYPQPNTRLSYKASPTHGNGFHLTNGMLSGTSSPRKSTDGSAVDREKLLNECILSAMPGAGGSPAFSSKNEMGGPTLVTRLVRHHQTGRLQDSNFVDENSGEASAKESSLRNSLINQDSVSSEESDDFFCKNDFDDLDTSLPLDCLEEPMTIDCSSLRSDSSSGDSKTKSLESTSAARKTRLPMPTSKVLQSSNCRSAQLSVKPKIGPKPLHSQAVVPPFNYQKPMHVNDESSSESTKSGNMHSNTMLVTTV